MYDKLKNKHWDALKPWQKNAAVVAGLAVSVIVAGMAWSWLEGPPPPPPKSKKLERKTVSVELGDGTLKKAVGESARQKIEEYKKEQDRETNELLGRIKALEEAKAGKTASGAENKAGGVNTTAPLSPPPPSPYVSPSTVYPPPPSRPANEQQFPLRAVPPPQTQQPPYAGGIAVVHNPDSDKKPEAKKDDSSSGVTPPSGKKKAKHKIPAGAMMEAVLLTGTEAPTIGEAANDPTPLELMIIDESILPNHIGLKDVLPGNVRASLKGCFVIAKARGHLATERVDIRPITLSCISKGGRNVVEAKIKGWVSDVDSKNSVQGKPISRNGQMLARAGTAGFIKGVAEAFSASSSVQNLSALGTQTTINAGKVGQAGASKGFSTAAEKLADYYMKLAEQTLPVIEVLGMKRLTIHLEEAVVLDIEEACIGFDDFDEERKCEE